MSPAGEDPKHTPVLCGGPGERVQSTGAMLCMLSTPGFISDIVLALKHLQVWPWWSLVLLGLSTES